MMYQIYNMDKIYKKLENTNKKIYFLAETDKIEIKKGSNYSPF